MEIAEDGTTSLVSLLASSDGRLPRDPARALPLGDAPGAAVEERHEPGARRRGPDGRARGDPPAARERRHRRPAALPGGDGRAHRGDGRGPARLGPAVGRARRPGRPRCRGLRHRGPLPGGGLCRGSGPLHADGVRAPARAAHRRARRRADRRRRENRVCRRRRLPAADDRRRRAGVRRALGRRFTVEPVPLGATAGRCRRRRRPHGARRGTGGVGPVRRHDARDAPGAGARGREGAGRRRPGAARAPRPGPVRGPGRLFVGCPECWRRPRPPEGACVSRGSAGLPGRRRRRDRASSRRWVFP